MVAEAVQGLTRSGPDELLLFAPPLTKLAHSPAGVRAIRPLGRRSLS